MRERNNPVKNWIDLYYGWEGIQEYKYSRPHVANGWSSDYFANGMEHWKKGCAKKKVINDFAKCLLGCAYME